MLYVLQGFNVAICSIFELTNGKTRPLDPFDSSMVRIRGIEYDFLVSIYSHHVQTHLPLTFSHNRSAVLLTIVRTYHFLRSRSF